MICKKCGTEYNGDGDFCPECGAPIYDTENIEDDFSVGINANDSDSHENIDSENPENLYPQDNIADKQPLQNIDEIKKSQLDEIQERRLNKKRREKRNKIIIIAILSVLIIGAIGTGTYYYRQNFGEGIIIETPRPSATPDISASPEALEPTPSLEPSQTPVNTQLPEDENNGQSSNSNTATNSVSSNKQSSSSKTQKPTKTTAPSKTSKPASTKKPSSSSSQSSSNNVSSSANKFIESQMGNVNMGDDMNSQIIKGSEIITNSSGKRVFAFTISGQKFVANIDPYSTTQQVKNTYYIIDAKPTAETFDGLPIYEISSINKYTLSDYILPTSSQKLLTSSDLAGLTKQQLSLARNEIYARHGRTFKNAEYQNYFNSKSWYKVNPNYNYSNDSANLSTIEKQNILLITAAENK